ncbi:alkaline phosphatase PhoX [Kordia sp.]|uniref:alkaline phosphatase PhoX n=1 Tax=Kordia sp. TaxID=1965332 RepID=UPI003D6A034A
MKTISKILALAGLISFASCNNDDNNGTTTTPDGNSSVIDLKNHSMTPAFVTKQAEFNDIEVYSILSSEDILSESPNFVYGSMADGCGLLRNEDGTFTLINNIEADYSIARITLDATFKPIKGEYIVNSDATGNTAQCSGSLATPEEHGYGPVYLSGGEWGAMPTNNVFMVDPYKSASEASVAEVLPAMGQWTIENAVPLGKDAFPGKTIVMIGDDSRGDAGGQLAMYVSNTVGDLHGGNLYGLRVGDGTITDNDLVIGDEYDIEFVHLDQTTYNELNTESMSKGIMAFNRVEDIDYRKGSAAANREIYFNATGHSSNSDTRTKYGRVYKLVLDENNPLTGKLTLVLNGDDLTGKAKTFHSPDNILVTENYAYIQEDPNGYVDDMVKQHDAYLYQYDLNTGTLKVVLESAHRTVEAVDNGYASFDDRWGKWELTGMIDISDIIGEPDTFLLIQQAHSWYSDVFLNPDGAGTDANSRNEGSILLVVKGLAR